jgi:hypothetical protein
MNDMIEPKVLAGIAVAYRKRNAMLDVSMSEREYYDHYLIVINHLFACDEYATMHRFKVMLAMAQLEVIVESFADYGYLEYPLNDDLIGAIILAATAKYNHIYGF